MKTLRGWIDGVPRDAVLPAMPGFDRDEMDALIEQHPPVDEYAVSEAIEMASDWIACVPESVKVALPVVPDQFKDF